MTGLGARIDQVLALDPGAPAIEFEGAWHTWGALARTGSAVGDALGAAGLGPGAPIGVLLRNRPSAVAVLLGVLRAGACVVALNPLVGATRVGDDVTGLGLPLVVGDAQDVDALGEARLQERTTVLSLDGLDGPPRLEGGGEPASPSTGRPGVAVLMLTSGTTGPPKRVELTYRMLERVMEGAKHYESGSGRELRLRDGVVIVNAPLVHLGGLFRVLQGVLDGRRLALLPRFTVDGWVAAVRRHRPKTVSLVPTALRMVLDADVPADVFESVRSVVSGTAPLDPDLADELTARYGVPVLTSYAATEFGGGVAGWNLADHREFGVAKRGSVGRAHAGCALRVVDQGTGSELPAGEVGLLEVRAAQLDTSDWVRTTDLARLDEDGFLWVVGRADQTILRGGFKVQPEVVRSALERLPGVGGAAVVGVDDARLGHVPVAAVVPVAGADLAEAAILGELARELAPYEVPVEVRIVAELPTTPSGKTDLGAVQALFARGEAGVVGGADGPGEGADGPGKEEA